MLCSECFKTAQTEAATPESERHVTVAGTKYPAKYLRGMTVDALCGPQRLPTIGCETPGCKKWEHLACLAGPTRGLRKRGVRHHCLDCVIKAEPSSPPADPEPQLADLPQAQTTRARCMSAQLHVWLPELGKNDVVATVVEASRRNELKLPLGPRVKAMLKKLDLLERWWEKNVFRSTTFLLFARKDGVETVVGAIVMHEFTSGPQKGLVYLSYLDSLNHLQPGLVRSCLLKAFVASAVDVSRAVGGNGLYIFPVTPRKGVLMFGSWFFHQQPADMCLGDQLSNQLHLNRW